MMRLATYHGTDGLVAAFAVNGRLVDAARAARVAGLHDDVRFQSVRRIVGVDRPTLHRVHDAACQLAADDALGTVYAAGARLAPPVPDPDKIICLGLNYGAHAQETAMDRPAAPMLFAKYPNSLAGHEDPVALPAAWGEKVDYEGEIAVVIGRAASGVDQDAALAAVAGWMPFNDI